MLRSRQIVVPFGPEDIAETPKTGPCSSLFVLISSSLEVELSGRRMTSSRKTGIFNCPNCDALYQVVKSDPGLETIDHSVTCRSCRAQLPAREGKFVLKYFLLRNAIRNQKWQRRSPPGTPR